MTLLYIGIWYIWQECWYLEPACLFLYLVALFVLSSPAGIWKTWKRKTEVLFLVLFLYATTIVFPCEHGPSEWGTCVKMLLGCSLRLQLLLQRFLLLNQRLRTLTTWITFLRMALHLRCKLLILSGPKKWKSWYWKQVVGDKPVIDLSEDDEVVALNQKPSTPELAELDSPSSENLFEHDKPLSPLTKDLLRGQQQLLEESDSDTSLKKPPPPVTLGISNQPLHALRLMGPEFDPHCSLQSDPNEDDSPEAMSSGPDDREGASLGTQANKQSSVTAFLLCLAAAGAAGADCNGSARANGVKSFCFFCHVGSCYCFLCLRKFKAFKPIAIVIIRMDLGVTISLSAGIKVFNEFLNNMTICYQCCRRRCKAAA